MLLQRPAAPALRPFVQCLWTADGLEGATRPAGAREHVLPTGTMHLAVRLSGPPVRVGDAGPHGALQPVGLATVGGARAAAYAKDASQAGPVVGAQLRPGAAEQLLGVPAGPPAGRHTPLELVWGGFADELRERLAATASLEAQVDVLETLLLARLAASPGREKRPEMAFALSAFARGTGVAEVVRATGLSHRRFVGLFRESVGLAPKLYSRVLRFQEAVRHARDPALSLVDVAMATGYADQAHFHRDFVEFAGITPAGYRAAALVHGNHVPVEVARVGEARSISFKTRAVRWPDSAPDPK